MEWIVGWYVINTIATYGVGYWLMDISDELTVKDVVILILLLILPLAPIMGLMVLAESDVGDKVIFKKGKK